MILLTSTSDILQINASAAGSVQVHCSYVDLDGSTVTPGRTNTSVSFSGLTTIVASPASSTQRNVKFISVQNGGASTLQVIVQHVDSTPTTINLMTVSLQPNYTLFYSDLQGWGQMDNAGGLCETPLTGRWIGMTLLTSGTIFTTTGSTNSVRVRAVGGGGGGGGCAAVNLATGAAGGGGAGGYTEITQAVTPNTAYTYSIGAAGTGSAGAAGNNGGNTTATIGATTIVAFGGTGGPLCTPVVVASQPLAVAGGAGGAVSTGGGAANGAGAPGDAGVSLSLTIYASGSGGSGPFGGGGLGLVAAGVGTAAAGFGAGGGGSAAVTNATRAGGTGTAGCVIVDEYS